MQSAASEPRRDVTEVLGVTLGTLILVALLGLLGRVVPLVGRNLHTLVALLFLFLPQLLLRRRGNIERYGFTTHPRRLGLAIALVAIVALLPLYAVGFWLVVRAACVEAPALVPSCAEVARPLLRLPPDLAAQALGQLVVVALPEELFFRAYVQGRLEEAWPPRQRLWGAPVGRAWLVSSLLFGVGHLAATPEPLMLTRIFPGLAFGWMYARTHSILPSTLFHAACNLTMALLGASLFP